MPGPQQDTSQSTAAVSCSEQRRLTINSRHLTANTSRSTVRCCRSHATQNLMPNWRPEPKRREWTAVDLSTSHGHLFLQNTRRHLSSGNAKLVKDQHEPLASNHKTPFNPFSSKWSGTWADLCSSGRAAEGVSETKDGLKNTATIIYPSLSEVWGLDKKRLLGAEKAVGCF
jgi:hypothetical protein